MSCAKFWPFYAYLALKIWRIHIGWEWNWSNIQFHSCFSSIFWRTEADVRVYSDSFSLLDYTCECCPLPSLHLVQQRKFSGCLVIIENVTSQFEDSVWDCGIWFWILDLVHRRKHQYPVWKCLKSLENLMDCPSQKPDTDMILMYPFSFHCIRDLISKWMMVPHWFWSHLEILYNDFGHMKNRRKTDIASEIMRQWENLLSRPNFVAIQCIERVTKAIPSYGWSKQFSTIHNRVTKPTRHKDFVDLGRHINKLLYARAVHVIIQQMV